MPLQLLGELANSALQLLDIRLQVRTLLSLGRHLTLELLDSLELALSALRRSEAVALALSLQLLAILIVRHVESKKTV